MPTSFPVGFSSQCPPNPRREATGTVSTGMTQAQVRAVLDAMMEEVANKVEDDGCTDLANLLRGAL